MKWLVLKRDDQDFVQVIPIGDFEPHDENEQCRCEPKREIVDDGCDLLIHEAYNDLLAKGPLLPLAKMGAEELATL